MKRALYTATLFLFTGLTTAAYADGDGKAAASIGDALKTMVSDVWNPFLLLTTMVCGLAGIYLLIKGLTKIVATAQNGGRDGYGSAMAYILLAALMIALPQASGMGMNTIFGGQGRSTLQTAGLDYDDGTKLTDNLLGTLMGGTASVAAPVNCISHEQPAVCMSQNIAANVIPMAVMALFSFTFLAGLMIAGATVMQWAKSTDRSDNGRAYITRIVTAILLMNASVLFRIVTKTAMGQESPVTDLGHAVAATSPLLSYKSTSTSAIVNNYAALLGNAFVILVFFGAWAFVRGVFMVKSVAEAGRQGGSYGMAATYIVAGILLANAKFSTCLILRTALGGDAGVDFCTG